MLESANISVGLRGREGIQASLVSDVSFSKFRFLERLILIHGRFSLIRLSYIANYCIYKSILIAFVQLFFSFFSGFSGVSFFTSTMLVINKRKCFCLTILLTFIFRFVIILYLLHFQSFFAVKIRM